MTVQVSVIIVTYNSADEIAACLDSLQQQTAISREVIVIDNASQDGTLALLQQRQDIRLIADVVNRGFAAAVNRAAQIAGGEYLLLLNPDAVLQPTALSILVDYLAQHPQVGLVAPRILTADGKLRDNTFAFESPWSFIVLTLGVGPFRRLHGRALRPRRPWQVRADQPQQIDAAIGAALLVRRPLFEQLGGLDARFFLYCEDGDFCLRAARAGAATYLVPQAQASHVGGASTPQGSYRLTGMIGRHLLQSRYRFTHKYHGRAAAAALRLLFAVGGAIFLLIGILTPQQLRREQLLAHGRLLWSTPLSLRESQQLG